MRPTTTYKTEKLKARIVEKFGTQKAFADAVGMYESTLSRYLSSGKDWKGSLLIKAVEVLEIPADQIEAYFFEPVVAKRKQKEATK